MKKLIIAAAIVCAAALTHAAQFDWAIEAVYDGYQIDKTYGGDFEAWSQNAAPVSGATLYLIDAALCDSSKFLTDWQNGSSVAKLAESYAVAKTAGVNSGTLTADGIIGTGDYLALTSVKDDFSAFAAFEKDGYLYLSENVPFNHNDKMTPKVDLPTQEASGVFQGTSYAGAGWYTAVPEPTSGLLLLLGVAGLALRRRRA